MVAEADHIGKNSREAAKSDSFFLVNFVTDTGAAEKFPFHVSKNAPIADAHSELSCS